MFKSGWEEGGGVGPVLKHPLNDEQNDEHNNHSVKFTIILFLDLRTYISI